MRTIAALPRGAAVLLVALVAAGTHAQQPREAEPATVAAQEAVRKSLPFADRTDFDEARAGFVASLPDALVEGVGGRPAWSMKPYAFLDAADAPPTVNPSLWRQAQLNAIHGLFKVADGIYQVRGFDIANMTIVEAATGVIVIDPLLTVEVARAALELYYAHRPRKPVVAVIYTHSHADHFGGVKGVTTEADVKAGRVRVVAPAGFMEHAVAENIIAGNAMSRRAQFQFGPLLPPGPRGQVDAGLGKNLSRGTFSLIAPTDSVERTLDTRRIDGVEIVFQLTPGTEAPAEMNLYFPAARVLNMAENTTHTLHNLYTIRGAEVRDARAWSRYISDALEQFAGRSDVLIAQHHWPTRGTARIQAYLKRQRDLYKFVHDQSVRLLNQGYTANEIAATLKLPASLANDWAARDYYGTLSHNSKAVYQKYLGWYDAHPAHLNELPPVEQAKKTVEYMGGAQAVLDRARDDFKRGNYRWVASVVTQVVYADPANRAARELAADAMEQLGYQTEAGTWRNAYLFGAMELRNGVTKLPAISTLSADALQAVPLDLFFDFLGVRLNGPRADGKRLVFNWHFTDTQQRFVLNLENAALTWTQGAQAAQADASLTLTRDVLGAITLRKTTFPEAVKSGAIQLQGDPARLLELLGLLDEFEPMFEVVEPKARR